MRGVTLIAWTVIAIGLVYVLSKEDDSINNKPVDKKDRIFDYIEILDKKERAARMAEAEKNGAAESFNVFLSPAENHSRKKRSMAIGRTRWRPGKRSVPVQRWLWLPSDHGDLLDEQPIFDRGQPEEVLPEYPQIKEPILPFPLHWRDVPTWHKRELPPDINFDFDFAHPICNIPKPVVVTPDPETDINPEK